MAGRSARTEGLTVPTRKGGTVRRLPPAPFDELPPGPPPLGDLDLTLPEISELDTLLGGSLLSPRTRPYLYRSWGFCPRHTWGLGSVDIELRTAEPFSVVVVYMDLAARAARLLAVHRRRDSIPRRLRSRYPCLVCDRLEFHRRNQGRAAELQARANRRQTTRELLAGSRPVWETRTCRLCLGGEGPLCRYHLLKSRSRPDPIIAEYLGDLAHRLSLLAATRTTPGLEVTGEEQSSWVETLGWFGGWEYPFRALAG